MNKILFIFALLYHCSLLASPASDLFFGSVPNFLKLSKSEKELIYNSISDGDINISPNQKEFVDINGDSVNFKINYQDINGDKNPEIFIIGGNQLTSGDVGSSVWLFIKKNGLYQKNLGFPSSEYKVLKNTSFGYRDIILYGSGFCYPIWKWDGSSYKFFDFSHKSNKNCKS